MEKVQLRNTLRKVRAIKFDRASRDAAMAPQEMLDFLAMLAGLKPVYLLGRGFEDPLWAKGIVTLSKSLSLHIVPGPRWAAQPEHTGLPDWYADLAPASDHADDSVIYICKGRSIAAELAAISTTRSVTIDQEARLLGYPVCCVRDHYHRGRLMNIALSDMLLRASGGDINEMRRLVRDDVGMRPETPEEISAIQAVTQFSWAPFTSFCMCRECTLYSKSPGGQISVQFEALARTIDPNLAREIEQTP
jgi:hypothetical protein